MSSSTSSNDSPAISNSTPIKNEVSHWLTSLGLERYNEIFASVGIDTLRLVKHIRRKDLVKMSIRASFHQDLLLREASKLCPDAPCDEVKVSVMDTNGACVAITLPWIASIEDLKLRIERDWNGVRPQHQKLVCKGRVLESGTLAENDVSSAHPILVMVDPVAMLASSCAKLCVNDEPAHPFPFLTLLHKQSPARCPALTRPPRPEETLPPSSNLPFSWDFLFQKNEQSPAPQTACQSSSSSSPAFSLESICRQMSSVKVSESFVVHFVRSREEITLNSSPDTTTIALLKKHLACSSDIPLDKMMIIVNCRVCENNDATIRSYGFKDGEKIYVVSRD